MPAAVTAILSYQILGTTIGAMLGGAVLSFAVSSAGGKKPKGQKCPS